MCFLSRFAAMLIMRQKLAPMPRQIYWTRVI